MLALFTDSSDGACNADCSLREAIRTANANSNADTIVLAAGTYTLTVGAGDLDLTQPLTIIGDGAHLTVIAMANTDRVMHVLTTTVTLNGPTLTGGSGGGAGNGLRLRVQGGNVTLLHSAVSGNTGSSAAAGLYATHNSTLTNTVVLSNTTTGTSSGGGLYVGGSGSGAVVTMTNVTVSNNTADYPPDGTGDGGGI